MHKVKIAEITSYDDKKISIFLDEFIPKDTDFKNKRILIKPNLLMAAGPDAAVTTHPLFVKEVIGILKDRGARALFLADSPGANFINYEKVLKATGMRQICDLYDVNILRVEEYKPKKVFDFIVSSIIDDFDLIINLPKLKTHSLMGLTLSVKNIFGLIPATHKVLMHKHVPDVAYLAERLYNFYKSLEHKMLNILDGIVAMEGDGPSRGNPVNINIVAGSINAVALDIAITEFLGFKAEFCRTNSAAINCGFNKDDIDVEYLNFNRLSNVKILKKPSSLKVNYVPDFIKSWFAGAISVKPFIVEKKCIKCKFCIKSCPFDAIKEIDNRIFIVKKMCLECFCCYEICEYNAINLHRSVLHRVFIR